MMTDKDGQQKDRMGYFRLDSGTYDQLEVMAKEDERPVSFLIRRAIEQYLRRRKAA